VVLAFGGNALGGVWAYYMEDTNMKECEICCRLNTKHIRGSTPLVWDSYKCR